MGNHQINELLNTTMTKLKEMIDVDIVIGQQIVIGNAYVIPVSEVKCGMISGGFDQKKAMMEANEFPFGGGSGGTWSVKPIAFLVVNDNDVTILHLEESTHTLEKVIDGVGIAVDKIINKWQKHQNLQN